MLSMKEKPFAEISSEAKNRGVTVQELLRAAIVPEWARENLQLSNVPQPSMQITPNQTKPSMSSRQRDSRLAITVGQLRTYSGDARRKDEPTRNSAQACADLSEGGE